MTTLQQTSRPVIHISGFCHRPLAIAGVYLAFWNHSSCCHGIEVIVHPLGPDFSGSVENRMLTEVTAGLERWGETSPVACRGQIKKGEFFLFLIASFSLPNRPQRL